MTSEGVAAEADPTDRVAPRRATTLTLTGGALLGAICFGVAVVADLASLGGAASSGASDTAAFLAGLLGLDPWAWALLGSGVIVATPAVGLVVSAVEFEAIGDRRAALMALVVVAVLGIGLLIALLT